MTVKQPFKKKKRNEEKQKVWREERKKDTIDIKWFTTTKHPPLL